ncbi:hypothetical protein FE257_012949 [Aspergillus nanangensis]|uniref:Lytic polysaccharide monooxygenase n=1 Tax=Aspergillus nanangensis TaxID=2582783 RepID=A0AAD4CFM4_ASPNN|nr:hypothetical protein FE257_012949 [Aspergillus nanangensis]
MVSKTAFVAAAIAGFSAVEAHITMSTPTPYGADTLNNSPLAADGSDFPCKLRSNTFEAPAEETIANIGEAMPMSFVGSAVHGGGSCQVSLTTDLQPTKDSEWMVIKSIEGGCPANADGNLAGGAAMSVPSDFNYTIPDGIEPGKYTLAWTWFNRIGNREMYMNCAPITVAGGSSAKRSVEEKVVEKRSSSFPPMFVANVNGCTTTEGVDIRFPNPGDVVEYAGEASNLASEGSEACSGTPSFGGAGDSSSGGSSGSSGSGSSSSSTAAPVVPTTLSVSVTAALPTASAPGIFVPTTTAAAPIEPTPSAPSTGSGSDLGALTGACSPEGLWNCIAGSSFQRCANGQWSLTQDMAAGTQCNAGQSQNFAISSILKPRMLSGMRHARRAHGAHHA